MTDWIEEAMSRTRSLCRCGPNFASPVLPGCEHLRGCPEFVDELLVLAAIARRVRPRRVAGRRRRNP